MDAKVPSWFKWMAIALVVVGLVFRLTNLGQKVYWVDETYTSLRISGYSEQEMVAHLYTGDVVTMAEVQAYQQPSADRTLADTLRSLTESPQHPPLYFALGYGWVKLWGPGAATLRSLSALFSVLILPAVYWLAWELFRQPGPAWMAIALFALSPFQVLYAQEARQYSLWMLLTLLASAALLRAQRQDSAPLHQRFRDWRSWGFWGLYAVLMALSFYTFFLTTLVALSHGVYVGLTAWRERSAAALTGYLAAVAAAAVAFLPWAMVMLAHLRRVTDTASWASDRFSIDWLVLRWLLYPINQFFDLSLGDAYLTSPVLLLMVAIAGLIGYSVSVAVRSLPMGSRQYLLCHILVPALALMVPDVVLGGQRSGTARYMIPVYLGLHLSVAYTLGLRAWLPSPQQRRWQGVTLALLLCGLLSCGLSSRATLWWNKSPDKHLHNDRIIAAIQLSMEQGDRPLLVSDDSRELSGCFACRILTLSYDLDPSLRLQLVRSPAIPTLPTDANPVFVFSPSQRLVRRLERQGYQAELTFEEDKFWFWTLTPTLSNLP